MVESFIQMLNWPYDRSVHQCPAAHMVWCAILWLFKRKKLFFFLEVPEWCEVFLFYSFTKAMDI